MNYEIKGGGLQDKEWAQTYDGRVLAVSEGLPQRFVDAPVVELLVWCRAHCMKVYVSSGARLVKRMEVLPDGSIR